MKVEKRKSLNDKETCEEIKKGLKRKNENEKKI